MQQETQSQVSHREGSFLVVTRSEVASFGGWKVILKSSCHIFAVLHLTERSLEAIVLQ